MMVIRPWADGGGEEGMEIAAFAWTAFSFRHIGGTLTGGKGAELGF